MNPEKEPEYSLEPGDEGTDDCEVNTSGETPAPREDPASEPPEPKPDSVHALDVCPNCGAAMPGSDSLLCLRCGFDLKTLKVVETKTGVTRAGDGDAEAPPLIRAGMGNRGLPLAFAAASVLLLIVACLAGWPGLFNLTADAPPTLSFGQRAEEAVQVPIHIALWTVCGVGALAVTARISRRPLGDMVLAAARMLGIVGAARAVSVLSLQWRSLELIVEALLGAAIFFGLTVFLFRMSARDAGRAIVLTVGAFFVLYAAARLVVWAV